MSGWINSIIAGFAGGLAAHGFAYVATVLHDRRRNNKSDTSACVEDAIANIAQICENAEAVWNGPGGVDTTKQHDTVCKIQELSELVAYIWEIAPSHKTKLLSCLAEFHRTVTGDDFDTAGREAKPEKMITIRGRATSLRIELLRVRRKH